MRKSRIKGVRSPSINAQLCEAMHQRDYYHRKALKTKSANHWSRYKELKNYVNKETKRCKSEYYSKLITENKSNPSALWKTLNDITSRKKELPFPALRPTVFNTATINLSPRFSMNTFQQLELNWRKSSSLVDPTSTRRLR